MTPIVACAVTAGQATFELVPEDLDPVPADPALLSFEAEPPSEPDDPDELEPFAPDCAPDSALALAPDSDLPELSELSPDLPSADAPAPTRLSERLSFR